MSLEFFFFLFYLFLTGNTVLIVAHASSLEACTRQIQGLSPQNSKDFVQVVRKVSSALSQMLLLSPSCTHPLPVPACSLFISCTSVLSCLQIPYLGFCACEEMGETGVWQLVDPPILPLTHGPNHSFNWREMLTQDWRICCLASYLLSAWTAETLFIFFPFYISRIPFKLPKGQSETQHGFQWKTLCKKKKINT